MPRDAGTLGNKNNVDPGSPGGTTSDRPDFVIFPENGRKSLTALPAAQFQSEFADFTELLVTRVSKVIVAGSRVNDSDGLVRTFSRANPTASMKA